MEPIVDGGAVAGCKRKIEATQNMFEWETSKENVMPLKRGRNVQELNRTLRANDSYHEKIRLDAQAKAIEKEIEEYKGDDPLKGWADYVRWIEKKMPEDTRKKFTVLEKCTRVLKDKTEYRNDIRYIRLWIQYADLVSNPKDIFKYLYQKKIGEHVSLFYVGWAWVLESMANYAQAHKIYLKATQKKAQPHELLARKYKEFQRRMSRHWLRMNDENGFNNTDEMDQRRALENISAHGQTFDNMHQHQQEAFARAERIQKANAHKPVFAIYEDPIDHEIDFLDSSKSDWRTLDTIQHQDKENEVAASTWNQATLSTVPENGSHRQLGRTERTPVPTALEVFTDPEFSDVSNVKSNSEHHLTVRSVTLRQRIEGEATEEEMLVKKPLKNFGTKDEFVHKMAEQKPLKKQKAKETTSEKIAYNLEQLKTDSGMLSFEEVRARIYQAKSKNRQTLSNRPQPNRFFAQPTQPTGSDRNTFLAKPANSFLESSSVINTSVHQDQIIRKLSFATSTKKLSPRQQVFQGSVIPIHADSQEDVTINTRLAMEDVNNMFCSPQRETEVKVWDLREEDPVERKLHFSVFDDSVDSVALNMQDQSLRQDPNESMSKNSFQVYSDEPNEAPSLPAKTWSQQRKPLGIRDDLMRNSRLTNKDVIMQMQVHDDKQTSKEKSASPRIYHTKISAQEKQHARPTTSSIVQTLKSSKLQLDPYKYENRLAMIQNISVETYLLSRTDAVGVHSSKLPLLPCSNTQKKFKKPISLRFDKEFDVEVFGVLGSGAFACVFSAVVTDKGKVFRNMALKYEKYRNNLAWEFYITHKLRKQLMFNKDFAGENIPVPLFHSLHLFKNGSILLMEKGPVGTLHDVLNSYKKAGKPFPEQLAIYYSIKMLYSVELLHDANVLHGDIKPDNWLMIPGSSASVLGIACASKKRSNMYQTGDLCLIDYGRSIDLSLYPEGTSFIGDCHTKGFQCVEMLSNKPWTKQIDTFGVCGTIHCLLFGDYMEVKPRKTQSGLQRWTITKAFKRYWQVDMWTELFDTLLNVKSCSEQPSLPLLRRRLESYFATDPHHEQVPSMFFFFLYRGAND